MGVVFHCAKALVDVKGDDYAGCRVSDSYAAAAVADGVSGSDDEVERYGVARGIVAAEAAVEAFLEAAAGVSDPADVGEAARLLEERLYTTLRTLGPHSLRRIEGAARRSEKARRLIAKLWELVRRRVARPLVELLSAPAASEQVLVSRTTLVYAAAYHGIGLVAGYAGDGYLYLAQCPSMEVLEGRGLEALEGRIVGLMIPHSFEGRLTSSVNLEAVSLGAGGPVVAGLSLRHAWLAMPWSGLFEGYEGVRGYAVILATDGAGLGRRLSYEERMTCGGRVGFQRRLQKWAEKLWRGGGGPAELLGRTMKSVPGDVRLVDLAALVACGALNGAYGWGEVSEWLTKALRVQGPTDDATVVVLGIEAPENTGVREAAGGTRAAGMGEAY